MNSRRFSFSRRGRYPRLCALATSLFLFNLPLQAGIVGVAGGTAAPAPTLGSYAMTPFPLDGRPLGNMETTAPSPLGGNLSFSQPLTHVVVGGGWSTWSNGYLGDVYYESTNLTIGMPANTGAFYLYSETDPFSVYTITAMAQDGTTVSQNVNGNGGASYFGFYGTLGDTIVSVNISAAAPVGVGEFGIAIVPEPGAIMLAGTGLAALGALALRRRVRARNSRG